MPADTDNTVYTEDRGVLIEKSLDPGAMNNAMTVSLTISSQEDAPIDLSFVELLPDGVELDDVGRGNIETINEDESTDDFLLFTYSLDPNEEQEVTYGIAGFTQGTDDVEPYLTLPDITYIEHNPSENSETTAQAAPENSSDGKPDSAAEPDSEEEEQQNAEKDNQQAPEPPDTSVDNSSAKTATQSTLGETTTEPEPPSEHTDRTQHPTTEPNPEQTNAEHDGDGESPDNTEPELNPRDADETSDKTDLSPPDTPTDNTSSTTGKAAERGTNSGESQHTALTVRIEHLEQEHAQFEAYIDAMEAFLDDSGTPEEIRSILDNLEEDVARLGSRITALEQRQNEEAPSREELASQISALQNTVQDLQTE